MKPDESAAREDEVPAMGTREALDTLTQCRILAEGSDWKRDSGERLSEWIIRTLASKVAAVRSERPFIPEGWKLVPAHATVTWSGRMKGQGFDGTNYQAQKIINEVMDAAPPYERKGT